MDLHRTLLLLHLLGAAGVTGGALSLWVTGVGAPAGGDASSLDAVQRRLGALVNATLGLAILAGVALLVVDGADVLKLPWLHVMITAALAVGALNGIAGRKLRRGGLDEGARAKVRTMHVVSMVLAVVALGAGAFR